MKSRKRLLGPVPLLLATVVCSGASFSALAAEPSCRLLTATRVFDGVGFPDTVNNSVLVVGNKVSQVGTFAALKNRCATKINLGVNSTLLPGFIESHAHITFQNVNQKNVLEHGITTAQDTGGALMRPQGGQGTLRLLSAGPIIQAAVGSDPGAVNPAATGYPLNIFVADPVNPDLVGGTNKIAMAVSNATQAETVVDQLIAGGATAIKISLEPGGEDGAPWMQPHNHGDIVPATPWPILSLETVEAIVGRAHLTPGIRVIAHVGEAVGFERAVIAGVDELAHMPCAVIPEALIHEAIDAGMTFVTTMDTLSACHLGIHENTHVLNHHMDPDPLNLGAALPKIIYGSEIGHDNVPWGINGEEMHLMLHNLSGAAIGFDDVVNLFRSATSEAGARMGIPGLGTLTPNAPADIIAVKGNPFERFKILEYPDLVMSGGKLVVNKF
jgi:imidazolonepropionase-like amidohydrolase